MREVAGYSLWLGHVGDLRNISGVLDVGIVAVVDLAGNEPAAAVTRDLIYLRFPLLDGPDNPPWLLRAAIEAVASLLRNQTPTLVSCGAGMSRSPSIAGAAIALIRGCSLPEGLGAVSRPGAVDISPGLWRDVVAALR